MARRQVIICSIVSLALLVTIILIAASLSVLSYTEVGLNYSNWFKTVEDKTYGHGIHFIGLGHTFQRYEIKLNTIEFSQYEGADLPMIKCRTKDGLELDLEASLQYRVNQDDIFKIYTKYGTEERLILIRVIIDVISETASRFSSTDFFSKRSEIHKAMKDDLKQQILANTYHEVVFFQLRSLSLPDSFENEIENTEVKGQDILKASSEAKRDNVMFRTNVIVAELAVNATLEQAYGNANKTIFEAQALNSTIQEVVQKQATAFDYMQKNLTFTDAEVINYLKTNLVKDQSEGKIIMHLDF